MASRELSNRGRQWESFHRLVLAHIEGYTVPQFGDAPDDQAQGFDQRDFQREIQRYANRIGTNARGMAEARRDCLKMAHYACMLWHKLQEEGTDDGHTV